MAKSKITTAQSTSRIGLNHSTFVALYGMIPASVKEKLTGAELGQLVDLLYAQKEYGADQMYRELK